MFTDSSHSVFKYQRSMLTQSCLSFHSTSHCSESKHLSFHWESILMKGSSLIQNNWNVDIFHCSGILRQIWAQNPESEGKVSARHDNFNCILMMTHDCVLFIQPMKQISSSSIPYIYSTENFNKPFVGWFPWEVLTVWHWKTIISSAFSFDGTEITHLTFKEAFF